MSWIRSIPIFSNFLALLLLGNLGSRIFANANAIECNQSWQKTTPMQSCQVSGNDKITNYACQWCGRFDKGVPCAAFPISIQWVTGRRDCSPFCSTDAHTAGLDCEGPSGKPLNTPGSFNCDLGMEYDDIKHVARPIRCTHLDTDGVARDYRCAKRHLNQQCPRDSCKVVNSY